MLPRLKGACSMPCQGLDVLTTVTPRAQVPMNSAAQHDRRVAGAESETLPAALRGGHDFFAPSALSWGPLATTHILPLRHTTLVSAVKQSRRDRLTVSCAIGAEAASTTRPDERTDKEEIHSTQIRAQTEEEALTCK